VKKLERVAVLGRGSAALRATHGLRKMFPKLELLSVASVRLDGFEGVTLPSVSSLASCGPVDWTFDCSPSSQRIVNAEELAYMAIPTLFEKPIGTNSREGQTILKFYQDSQTLMRVGYSLRRLQAFDFVKKTLHEGSIGQISEVEICCGQYLPDWRPGRDYRSTASAQQKLGGGVLLELSHEINYAIGLFGRVISVEGSLKNSGELDIDVEDWADGNLEMGDSQNPISVKLQLDFLKKKKERWCRITGDSGEIFWDLTQNTVHGSRLGVDFFHAFEDSIDQTYSGEIREMCDEVANQHSYSGDSKDSVHTLGVVDAWRISAKDKTKVDLVGVEGNV